MKFDALVKLYESQQKGPPYITVNHIGTKFYYKNPECTILHRLDGPAIIVTKGGNSSYWYKDNLLHREDGPAIERVNNIKEYYINGKSLQEEEFIEYLKKKEVSKEIQSHKNNRIDPRMLEDYL